VKDEKASELEAGISGRPENRGFKFGRHQIFFKSLRTFRFLIFGIEAYLSIIVHKYSSIVNGLAELSSRKPKARVGFSAAGRRGKYETKGYGGPRIEMRGVGARFLRVLF
jgi:hypothetical protein